MTSSGSAVSAKAVLRARAEAAHLEAVIQANIVAELESEGHDAGAAKVKLPLGGRAHPPESRGAGPLSPAVTVGSAGQRYHPAGSGNVRCF